MRLVCRPERWLDDAYVSKLHPVAWSPFSRGPRDCIGQQFALLEARVLLAELYRQGRAGGVPGCELGCPPPLSAPLGIEGCESGCIGTRACRPITPPLPPPHACAMTCRRFTFTFAGDQPERLGSHLTDKPFFGVPMRVHLRH